MTRPVTQRLLSVNGKSGTLPADARTGPYIDQVLLPDARGAVVMLELEAMGVERVCVPVAVRYDVVVQSFSRVRLQYSINFALFPLRFEQPIGEARLNLNDVLHVHGLHRAIRLDERIEPRLETEASSRCATNRQARQAEIARDGGMNDRVARRTQSFGSAAPVSLPSNSDARPEAE